MNEIGRALFRRELGIHVREVGGVLREGSGGDEGDDNDECGQQYDSGMVHSTPVSTQTNCYGFKRRCYGA